MPPWLPRLIRQIAFFVVAGWALFNVIKPLRGFLVLLLISLFLAIALDPAVTFLARRGWRRGLATGAMFLIVGLVAALFIALMVPLIIEETNEFVEKLPKNVEQASEFLEGIGIDVSAERLNAALTNVDSYLQGVGGDVAGSVFGVGTRLLSTIFSGLTILLFTFYLTADAPRLRRTVLSVLSESRQREVLRVIEIAIDKTGGYFYSRALLAALATFATWLALRIIGVDFALPLGIWVGVLSQFVPVVGTYLGGVLPILIAVLDSPGKALAVIIFIALYQQFENYVISPKITARTMQLHPAVAFGSAIVGATLLGAPGALMALPVAATVQAFVGTYLHRHELVEDELLAEAELVIESPVGPAVPEPGT